MKKILAFSCSTDATVDVVANICSKAEIVRIDTDKIKSKTIFVDYLGHTSLDDYDVVWYRRPFEFEKEKKSLENYIRQKELNEIIWNFFLQIPKERWMNFPAINWYADRKLIQLRDAPKFGLNVPPWIISSDKRQIKDFLAVQKRCLVKPMDNGYIPYGNKLFHIYSTELNDKISLNYSKNCPTLFQKIIEKSFDVRTIYVDGKVLFFKLESGNLDVRVDGMKSVKYSLINPPQKIKKAYCDFVKSYDMRFCTSDFVVDLNGRWFFLENNPNGNWAWLEEFFPGLVVDFFINSIRNK